ncbi:SRPBCC family protein [Halovivax limisalsi]|uniref:SRPBCC family protein n=1 Tax=Halovivax limisalsi TaxID=1453760 RepID=UPI001FFCEC2F|nr:SRPBCC family protein [Halovivax limisalsi]
MARYRTASVIEADVETVWDFYGDAEELRALTPDWLGLSIRAIAGPDGDGDPETYHVGTEITLELAPFGIEGLPGTEWTVEIVEREVRADRAHFVDEQVGDRGPFERWRHTHRFVDLGGGETLLVDDIEYRLPFVGDRPLATPALAAMLWYRHRLTRRLLE